MVIPKPTVIIVSLLFTFNTFFSVSSTIFANDRESMDLLENQAGKLVLAISIQWEGEDLAERNLDAIATFRKKYDSLSMIQFLNPVYFTKATATLPDVQKKIQSVIRPQDPIGMQILGWQSLIKDSGVTFRDSPTFWGNKLVASGETMDSGHEIPISTYTRDELVKIMARGQQILQDNGFQKPQAFMAGGWMASSQVMEAAVLSGFKYDFSGIPPHVVQSKIQQYPIYKWLAELWNGTTALSQPTTLSTQVGPIQEYYNNGGTLDYQTEKDIVDLYHAYANLLKQDPSKAYLMHIGLYQETAAKTLPRLESALQKIFEDSATNQVSISMLKIPAAQSDKDALKVVVRETVEPHETHAHH